MSDSGKDKSDLCVAFLTQCCGIPLDFLKTRVRLERIKVFTEKDVGFCGDERYDPPVDWCFLPLIQLKVTNKTVGWDLCYHGTRSCSVYSILRDELVVPGNRTSDGGTVEIRPYHAENQNYIFTSPSIHYASHTVYAQPVEWEYQDKKYYVRTVFQVHQKPDTYHIRRNTLHESCWDPTVSFDDHFKNEELEWYTSDQSTIQLAGLLIHFSDVPVRVLIKQRQDKRKRDGARAETSLKADRDSFQKNLDETKKKILWVDDHPSNNRDLVDIIRGSQVECIICKDTDDAVKKFRENRSDIYAIITDLVRKEKRAADSEEKDYFEAGIDFIREVKNMGVTQPIYMYSSWCRMHRNLIEKALAVGSTKVCTHEEIEYIIRKDPKK